MAGVDPDDNDSSRPHFSVRTISGGGRSGDLDCADVGQELYISGSDRITSTPTMTALVAKVGEQATLARSIAGAPGGPPLQAHIATFDRQTSLGFTRLARSCR